MHSASTGSKLVAGLMKYLTLSIKFMEGYFKDGLKTEDSVFTASTDISVYRNFFPVSVNEASFYIKDKS